MFGVFRGSLIFGDRREHEVAAPQYGDFGYGWYGGGSGGWLDEYTDGRTGPPLLAPLEQLPLGARIPTKNPKPWEYDGSLPEPDQSTWGKISITMFRSDGGIVDAELLRPRSWIARHKIVAGQHLPLNIEELQVHGSAFVTAVDDSPEIARGEGSVVTARFITREVNSIVRAEILGLDGKIEVIEGTPIHPIWSVDRNDWVPLGYVAEGESLQALGGIAKVSSLSLVTCSLPVYNIEVHGEHVYEVGEFGVLVHNLSEDCFVWASKHLDEIGGQMRHLKPTTANPYSATGFLPGDNPQFAAYAYHTLIEKGGKYYDEIFQSGVEMGQWVDEFKRLNALSDELFDLWYIIDDIPHFGVPKL